MGNGSGSGNVILHGSAPAAAVPPDPNTRQFGPVALDDQFRIAVGDVTLRGTVDLSVDDIPTPPTIDTIAAASFSLGWNETAGDWERLRAFEFTEAAGIFPAYNLGCASFPYLFDELANAGLGDIFLARGRQGVTFVRNPGPRGETMTQLAIDQVTGGATPFRRLMGAGKFLADVFEAINNNVGLADFGFWQLWDLATVAAVPTVLTPATLPVKVIYGAPRSTSTQPSPQVWPQGGYQMENGIVIAVSSTPLFWTAPAATLLAVEAITNIAFHTPELPY
jgi:hypothetical protein